MKQTKTQRRFRIKRRFKATLLGSAEQPRMSIFRSNKEIYAQIINDETGEYHLFLLKVQPLQSLTPV